jgi:uncharacterized lipoprotein YddW (UPF0748 family)
MPNSLHRQATAWIGGLLLVLLLSAGAGVARATEEEETRALWVVRTSLRSPESIRRLVTQARDSGFNTLIVQVRGRGTQFFLDGSEPRAAELSGQPPEFDPLATVLQEAHAAGLQVHAWINAFYVWSERTLPPWPEHIVNARPDWLMVHRSGRRVAIGDHEGLFTCPSHPGVRRHLRDIFLDVARRYDVDGLQFDFIRYPGPQFCYCVGCLARFRQWIDPQLSPAQRLRMARRLDRLAYPKALPAQWQQWRRAQVTSLVRWIYQDVKMVRPEVIVSAAVIPWGSYRRDFRASSAYASVGQDWYGWMRAGILDAVAPMTYQTSPAVFRNWVRGVRRDHPRFPIWFGIGAWLSKPEGAAAKIREAQRAAADGWILFSYTAITRNGTDDRYLRDVAQRIQGSRPKLESSRAGSRTETRSARSTPRAGQRTE